MSDDTESGHLARPLTGTGHRRGLRVAAILMAMSVLSGVVGWVAARRIRSPAEVAALAHRHPSR